MMTVNHYEVLGFQATNNIGIHRLTKLTTNEISKAYKSKALELHTDKRPNDPNAFQQLRSSYNILMDDNSHKIFDSNLLSKHAAQERQLPHEGNNYKSAAGERQSRQEGNNFKAAAEERQSHQQDNNFRATTEERQSRQQDNTFRTRIPRMFEDIFVKERLRRQRKREDKEEEKRLKIIAELKKLQDQQMQLQKLMPMLEVLQETLLNTREKLKEL